jgi:hypothetical protein
MNQPRKTRKVTDLFDWIRRQTQAPEPEKPRLRVTSHVARDLLQNAAYFNAIPKAVAEYVTNAIDSAGPGLAIRCEVTIDKDGISIADNGSGMTYEELSNFFQMHGENIQRKRGHSVRGKFGTGKSAAFGIANCLRIETVKDRLLNVVELRRMDVEAAQDGQAIPVREIAVNQPASKDTGTAIQIREMLIQNPDPGEVRTYLEKLLGQHLRLHKVLVNGAASHYHKPDVELTFSFSPPAPVKQVIGRAKCKLYASPNALPHEDNVVAVLCHGYLHATTLAGKSREPNAEFLFGEVEVPSLDEDPGPQPAFDNTRSLTLNLQNQKVQALETWLGACIDEVLKDLAERERKRQLARDQYYLRKVATRIKSFLDEDFLDIQKSMPWASMPGSYKSTKAEGGPPTRSQAASARKPRPGPSVIERGLGWIRRLLKIKPAPATRRPPRGAPVEFEIRYTRQGAAAVRARYDVKEGIIYLNRDHPQLRSAEREAGLQSNTYHMLCFDIAFTEYALAVSDYLTRRAAGYQQDLDPNELVQQILDRLGRKAADFMEAGSKIEETNT